MPSPRVSDSGGNYTCIERIVEEDLALIYPSIDQKYLLSCPKMSCFRFRADESRLEAASSLGCHLVGLTTDNYYIQLITLF